MHENYQEFVGKMVNDYGAIWCAIITKDGEVSAYMAKDPSQTKRFLRTTRSFFWTLETMGEMVEMPELEGKYLEIIWRHRGKHTNLYIFSLKNEIVMLALESKIENFMISLISTMDPKNGHDIPGLVGFGIGDYSGNMVDSYLNPEHFKGASEEKLAELKKMFENTARDIFYKFAEMSKLGFGEGEYMEVKWKNVTGWMFPYEEHVAAAVFDMDKIETIVSIMDYILNN